jgi:hypothetical protein
MIYKTEKETPMRIIQIALFLLLAQSLQANDQELDQAWKNFSDGLQQARHSLTDPASFAPEASERHVAEGYRYMLAHLGRLIETEMRQDPMFPEFFRSMDMLRKWTAENPDAMYLKAPIDDTGYYKITGSLPGIEEWRSADPKIKGPKAPRMVTFQTITDIPGTTGDLAEMGNCKNQTLDFINRFTMATDDDGSFEILIGPQRPEGHAGNFLYSRKTIICPSTGVEIERSARYLSVREIFSDWEQEYTIDMEISRLDSNGANRPAITTEYVAERLTRIGEELPNQIRFWQLLQQFPLEINGDTNGDGRRNMPVNGINPPAPPFTAGGVAGAQQLYAAGIYQLAEGEALVIKVTAPIEAHYTGFQLHTLWFEGPDQQIYTSSLSGHQLPVASDGSRYYIIASEDPGYQGWVDTTGPNFGSFGMRFLFEENPPAEQMPKANAQLVSIKELANVLPDDVKQVTADQRRAQIAVRQSHIKRRWRGH